MNRRTFIKTVIIGTGAITTGAIAKIIDALGKSEVVKIEPLFTGELGVYEGITIYDEFKEFKLHPYQEELFKAISSGKKFTILGGRQYGKSWVHKEWKKINRNFNNAPTRREFTRKIPRPNSWRTSKRI